ncbi:hypothetical protein MUY27_01420 [Mucilaginibacter sp. RS28]|uniref:Uncharacterized protein n=1 Tax=Mucilaginibacter straminoryzae TaxID=2932774 RepID=A0A9X1X2I9_9SPHI|nr:hypothetical protein [Mucilaginibacter straminoryzae]MCJ8208348.1 hypothetical protein [Mucilaginibacter straminoryzae]
MTYLKKFKGKYNQINKGTACPSLTEQSCLFPYAYRVKGIQVDEHTEETQQAEKAKTAAAR